MSYNLESNMSDRINFDAMVRQMAEDAASTMTPDLARDVLRGDPECKETAENAFDLCDFQADDPDEPGWVEDMDEAKARWMDVYPSTFRDALNVTIEMHDENS